MTKEKLAELARLRQLAEAATPGPWDDYYETGIRPCVMAYDENDKGLRSIRAFIADTQFVPDRAFIAAANPDVVLGLVNRIDELSARCAKLEAAFKDIKENGLRCDLNPTQPIGDWSEVTVFYLNYLQQIEASMKQKAREALKEET